MSHRAARLVALFLALFALPLSAVAGGTGTEAAASGDGDATDSPCARPSAAVEPARDCPDADRAGEGLDLEIHLQAEAQYGRAGPGGQVRADLLTDTDARLGLTGRWLPRGDRGLRGDLGLDLLGGGRAHLELGGFAGARFVGGSTLEPELGPQLTLGWTDEHVYVDGTLRGAWVPEKGRSMVLEQEVVAGLHLGGPVWAQARWVRVDVGERATDAVGVGMGVVF